MGVSKRSIFFTLVLIIGSFLLLSVDGWSRRRSSPGRQKRAPQAEKNFIGGPLLSGSKVNQVPDSDNSGNTANYYFEDTNLRYAVQESDPDHVYTYVNPIPENLPLSENLDTEYVENSEARQRVVRQANESQTAATPASTTSSTTASSTTTGSSSTERTTTSKPNTTAKPTTKLANKPVFPLPPFPIPGLPGFPNLGPKKAEPPPPPAKVGELYLPAHYNNLEIPKLNLGKAIGLNILSAVPVLVFMHVRNIRGIDESNQEIQIEVDFVVEWIDGELFDVTKVAQKSKPLTRPTGPRPGAPGAPGSNNTNSTGPTSAPGRPPPKSPTPPPNVQKILNPIFLDKIWNPDINMDNLVKVKQYYLMEKPVTLKFSPTTGFISYTSRLLITASCGMEFHYYPADIQTCGFVLRSYSYYSTDLDLSWLRHGVYLQDPSEPNFDVQINSITKMKEVEDINNVKKKSYDALHFQLQIRRKLSFHLVQTYLPSIFFIVITWLCFLIPSKMAEARIGVAMTTLLTLTAMFASVRESTPVVSYVKAIDIWMVACIFFVFLTLLEFAILLWMNTVAEDVEEEKKKIEERRARKRSKKLKIHGRKNSFDVTEREPSISEEEEPKVNVQLYKKISSFVDDYAFLIFSIIFVLFNVIYWSWLLTEADYFDWHVNSTHNFIPPDA